MSGTNRNSTPDGTTASSLRPPNNRGHHLRASADGMSGFSSPLASRIRPASEVYLNAPPSSQNPETEAYDKAAQKWLADLESYENTLDEMAAATLDQDFKDELSAIEQWFRVLSEAERTAALYALLQQTTPVQIRFFIAILQQMGRSHPSSGILSPANFEKDPMSSRMNELAMSEQTRHSFPTRPPPSPTTMTNRNSQLDPATVSAMFPDAAAALATQRARYSQVSGVSGGGAGSGTKSNRNSAIFENKPSSSLMPNAAKEPNTPASPWRRDDRENANNTGQQHQADNRPKSGGESMGNWQAPPPSAGLRSPRNPPPSATGTQQNIPGSLNTAGNNGNLELPELSPFGPSGGNWASMVNTPVVPMFQEPGAAQANADMIANATAMKLAAMSTVNNRFLIDSDVRKFRRTRGADGQPIGSPGLPPGLQNQTSPRGIPAISQNIIMYNEQGQPVQIPAAAVQAAQAQQAALAAAAQGSPGLSPGMMGGRSRPTSPGFLLQNANAGQHGHPLSELSSPQLSNGLLTPYQASPLLGNPAISLNQLIPGGDYGSDHSDLTGARGRSPRGSRRGSSKPPEDPTDLNLLNDIPQWLRSLRLHKYTDNLKDLKWDELVELDDDALEKRGVNALGARRKMLKVFEQVKDAKTTGRLPPA